MSIDEILNYFNDPKGQFPNKALTSALEQQEKITPHLLNILQNVLDNPEDIKINQMDYIFSLYILSKFREKKAFPYIIAMASLPRELADDLLGDCITQSLASFIISTFNGDLLAIKQLIENPEINEWSRNAALHSLVGLFAIDELNREDLINYLRLLFHSSLASKGVFTTSLVNVACHIYPEELMDEINNAFNKNKVDVFYINKKWITKILNKGKEACLSKYVYNYQFHLPIDNIEEEMSWMGAFEELEEYYISPQDHEDFTPEDMPYTRSTPKIGRNELCPCGSGKKFKKCCLN